MLIYKLFGVGTLPVCNKPTYRPIVCVWHTVSRALQKNF
jgi:hypothetical protein